MSKRSDLLCQSDLQRQGPQEQWPPYNTIQRHPCLCEYIGHEGLANSVFCKVYKNYSLIKHNLFPHLLGKKLQYKAYGNTLFGHWVGKVAETYDKKFNA